MSLTLDTSHSAIGPFWPPEQSPLGDNLRHASTAPLRSIGDERPVVVVVAALVVAALVVAALVVAALVVTALVVAALLVAAAVHDTFRDIDPDDPVNISFWFALELTQAAPQSFWLNDVA